MSDALGVALRLASASNMFILFADHAGRAGLSFTHSFAETVGSD